MNDKTPITILQELCVANGSQPIFNLIHDGTGTLNPVFKYEVSVTIHGNHIRAVGGGRSKKEAKHDSARVAIEKLSDCNVRPDKSPTISEVDILPRFVLPDAIRNLLELCEERKLPMPEYELIDDVGPPHARQFTMMCSVASLKQSAMGTTKKGAKQLSASNMIDLLRTVENDDITGKEIVSISKPDVNKILEQRQDKLILTKSFKEYGSPFANYDQEKCDAARRILEDNTLSNEEKTRESLKALDIEFEISEVPAIKNGPMYMLTSVRVEPEFCLCEYLLNDLYAQTNYFISVLLS